MQPAQITGSERSRHGRCQLPANVRTIYTWFMPTPVGPAAPDPDDPDTWDGVSSAKTGIAGSLCGKLLLLASSSWDL